MRARLFPVVAAIVALGASASPAQDPSAGGVARTPRSRALAGIVTDTARHLLPAVEVGLLVGREIVRAVRTDTSGRFELRDIPPGKPSIVVRRLGFHPRVYTVQIREGASRAFLPVVLEPMPAELEKVIVLARVTASRGRLKEFYERKVRNKGWGHYIDRDDIERRSPLWISDMLRVLPGVRVVPAGPGRSAVRLRGGCRPTLWVDGLPIRGAEIDEVVYPGVVAGIEVYRSAAGTPPQFLHATGCGAIVVWTRME